MIKSPIVLRRTLERVRAVNASLCQELRETKAALDRANAQLSEMKLAEDLIARRLKQAKRIEKRNK